MDKSPIAMSDPRLPTPSIQQLHGQRSRLQRELSEVRGVSITTMNRRTRLLRELTQVEDRIREVSRARVLGRIR